MANGEGIKNYSLSAFIKLFIEIADLFFQKAGLFL